MKVNACRTLCWTTVFALGCSSGSGANLAPRGDGGRGETGTGDAGAVPPNDSGPSQDAAPPGANGLESITLVPQGAVLQAGSTQQFSVTCVYADSSTDHCARAGGLMWGSTRTTAMTVSGSGLATWVTDPGAGGSDFGYVTAVAGGLTTRAAVFAQHPGDTWYEYPTPDYRRFQSGSATTVPLVVGSTATVGAGLEINADGSSGQPTGQPFSESCSWLSSNTSVATVDRHGLATGISPGTATITCQQAGNGVYGMSALPGWIAPGNSLDLSVVAGGSSNTTWYVRPDGGTPFVDAADTPMGQCDGLSDQAYPGSGVDQHCALGNIRYLWSDETTYQKTQWLISGGDTVIIAPNPNGYNTGLDQPSPYQTPAGSAWLPINCAGNPGCTMPSIPSGTASRHTRILGANYANCSADSDKTLLIVSYAAKAAFDVSDSQFVDIACFEITDKSPCATNGNFTNACAHDDSNYGADGILQSAMTSQVTYTDLFIHGLANEAINGASGLGVVLDDVHIRASPEGGLDMDDAPWQSSNISVAGGLTMKNSITEFTGCVEEYPVVHNYPYIECRDQNTGGYGDGFGTGSTTGGWTFDHDTWRYNFQDGLDILHSGMQDLTVTNCSSYGNDGAAYKIGSADSVVFRNNVAVVNCNRISQTFGDEPSSAIVPGVATCRASGDGIGFHLTNQGNYQFQFNTFVGYNATPYDMGCEGGWDFCQNATALYQNNIVLGYSDPLYNSGEVPALFYPESNTMPLEDGWSSRDHNMFANIRSGWCPMPLQPGEACDTLDPAFVNQPASPIMAESDLDGFNFHLSAGSAAATAGVYLQVAPTDMNGFMRPNPPSLGAVQLGSP